MTGKPNALSFIENNLSPKVDGDINPALSPLCWSHDGGGTIDNDPTESFNQVERQRTNRRKIDDRSICSSQIGVNVSY